ncbi:MAG: HAD family hydrolase [Cyanobacteriota bacterium]|nr:HAD family hydrolase [Cyanobacteriota bacterium]
MATKPWPPLAEVTDLPRPLQLIATDMDGTLTRAGKLTADLLRALEQLQRLGLPVVIVTGRSAGWVGGLVHYLPVAGAIAENGGVYLAAGRAPEILTPGLDLDHHRTQLSQVFSQLQAQWPQLQPSEDNPFRLTDWTFPVGELSREDLTALQHTCQDWGWGFTYSTVQGHLFPPGQSKAQALQQVLGRYFPTLTREGILTVGDSPNDESLFDRRFFPHSWGVANIQHYWSQLHHHPTWVSQAAELDGFLEIVALHLTASGRGAPNGPGG